MKTYFINRPHELREYKHPHPERTAYRWVGFSVECKVWTNRATMLKTVEIQQSGPSNPLHWTPLYPHVLGSRFNPETLTYEPAVLSNA